MRNILVAFVFMLFVSPIAYSQNGQKVAKTPQEKAELLTSKMVTWLELSPEQTEKVKAINLATAEKKEAFLKDAQDKKLKKKRENAEIEAQREVDLKSVLTPEQLEKYQKMREKQHDKRKKDKKHQ